MKKKWYDEIGTAQETNQEHPLQTPIKPIDPTIWKPIETQLDPPPQKKKTNKQKSSKNPVKSSKTPKKNE